MLDPELNPMAIIQPYLQDFVLGNRDWQQIAIETVRDMALSAVTLPDDLRKYLARATRGEIEVRVKGVQEGARTVYATGRQLIYTAIGIACGLRRALAPFPQRRRARAVAARRRRVLRSHPDRIVHLRSPATLTRSSVPLATSRHASPVIASEAMKTACARRSSPRSRT